MKKKIRVKQGRQLWGSMGSGSPPSNLEKVVFRRASNKKQYVAIEQNMEQKLNWNYNLCLLSSQMLMFMFIA